MSQQKFFIDKHFIYLSTRNTKNLKTELYAHSHKLPEISQN